MRKGNSPEQLKDELRSEKAKELLLSTSKPVRQVAELLQSEKSLFGPESKA